MLAILNKFLMRRITWLVRVLAFGFCLLSDQTFADDDSLLGPEANAENVTDVLQREIPPIVEAVKGGHEPGFINPANEQAINHVINLLKGVKPKVLIEVMNHPDSRLMSLDSQILGRALDANTTEADIPDLLETPSEEATRILLKHPAWCRGSAVTTSLPTIFANIQAELFSSPDQLGAEGVLQIANLNQNPTIQGQLHDLIDKATATPNTSPLFLLTLLNTAASSDNSAVHSQLPEIIGALAKVHDQVFSNNYLPATIAQAVSQVVERNPVFLKNPDFVTDAMTCIKRVESNYSSYFGQQEKTASFALALLGDTKAYDDTMEGYTEFVKASPSTDQGFESVMLNKQQADEVEKWLISSIIYHGSGDKKQDIQDHYREAVYQNGQWILTMPGYIAPDPQ